MPPQRRLKPRTQAKQVRSRETVEAIVEAAAQVFERYGYAAGTTNRIAERAGVSIGSLYQYFPGKDAILVELIRRHAREGAALLTPLLTELTETEAPLEQGLTRLVQAMVDLHRFAPRLHRVLFEEAPHPEDLLQELRTMEDSGVAALERWFSLLDEVRVGDLRIAALLTATIGESLAHRLIIHPDADIAPDRYARETVRMLSGYLRGAG
jgi:AcrR family transcriptional regulator